MFVYWDEDDTVSSCYLTKLVKSQYKLLILLFFNKELLLFNSKLMIIIELTVKVKILNSFKTSVNVSFS